MWRDYFGPQAKIIGIDVDPACRQLEAYGFEIWIGDQGDPAFWAEFKAQHPKLDIVLDDGGHTMRQQLVTFDALFPIVSNGGLYVVEDTHTSYFPSHGGGAPGIEGTFMDRVKRLIDEMHAWYYAPVGQPETILAATEIPSITIFDSIVAIEKRRRTPPITLARGGGGTSKKSSSNGLPCNAACPPYSGFWRVNFTHSRLLEHPSRHRLCSIPVRKIDLSSGRPRVRRHPIARRDTAALAAAAEI